MPEEIISDAVASVPTKKSPKKKTKAEKLYPKKLDKTAENDLEFSGRVESINVKGTGTNANQFNFSLIGKKGAHKSYSLDPADPVRFSTMANILVAASSSGAKIKIRSVPNANGPSFASELEVRVKN